MGMITNLCSRKSCDCEKHLMNLLIIFTVVSFIFYLNFMKVMFISLYFLFTLWWIGTNMNLSKASQHTLVLELLNLWQMRLLSQVTLCFLLIKQLQFCRLRWENLRIHLLTYHHLLPSHILRILAQVWTVISMFTMKWYFLILHPLVPLVLRTLICCVHTFQMSLLMFMRIKLWMELVFRRKPTISFMMTMCGSPHLNKNLRWR